MNENETIIESPEIEVPKVDGENQNQQRISEIRDQIKARYQSRISSRDPVTGRVSLRELPPQLESRLDEEALRAFDREQGMKKYAKEVMDQAYRYDALQQGLAVGAQQAGAQQSGAMAQALAAVLA